MRVRQPRDLIIWLRKIAHNNNQLWASLGYSFALVYNILYTGNKQPDLYSLCVCFAFLFASVPLIKNMLVRKFIFLHDSSKLIL